jgi:hypothetical protein
MYSKRLSLQHFDVGAKHHLHSSIHFEVLSLSSLSYLSPPNCIIVLLVFLVGALSSWALVWTSPERAKHHPLVDPHPQCPTLTASCKYIWQVWLGPRNAIGRLEVASFGIQLKAEAPVRSHSSKETLPSKYNPIY